MRIELQRLFLDDNWDLQIQQMEEVELAHDESVVDLPWVRRVNL